ncbi:thiol-disulfide oxidoreductase [Pueribacillus theae]|uniref:Thiol-disulfide oxidoreductase n=1 Tax=Pueribacillus theae TaxID=2171751 RepID=A0A2U1JYM7_9BACI|nr:thiol-disulfide oxidoreductase ResA [Pueribacillus theae]PWA10054.1 thiol-disulfide oxidoreductase [Pueribacillus theae]
MEKKKRRLLIRTSILLVLVAAIGYTIFTSVFNDRKVVHSGDTAPNFQLQTLDGKTVQLSDYKGKGVFLNFWATYCPPCKEEMPFMDNQYQTFKEKGIEILAVNVGEPSLTAQKFVERYDLTFPILLDEREEVYKAYGVKPIPATFLIDKDGKVVDRVTKGLTEAEIQQMMEKITP